MFRFFFQAFFLLLAAMAVMSAAFAALGLLPGAGEPVAGGARMNVQLLTVWAFEALALITLFLVVQGRFASWWLDGLVAGWLAWIFRGPLLVVTIAGARLAPPQAWWNQALRWWLVYTVCGLLLAAAGRSIRPGAVEEEP
ncbi:MAG TPA: hypothetical protein VF017_10380 [Thermoanaerobaculia bacterium]|nr:hypothetical protein [Thermoanaerobaculia bacterium]